ncbi:MAG: AMP-binding protein, partial [Oscillospiraceae bacterium]|nr:AMP-binding protein [Oscillospiraceae bacterium]
FVPLHKRVEMIVKKMSDRTAIVDGKGEVTYAQLWKDTERIASVLADHNVNRGDKVGILLPKSRDQIVAVLAILYLGAVYVPLDEKQPVNRINLIIEKTGMTCILGEYQTEDKEICAELIPMNAVSNNTSAVLAESDASDLAYIIFTSGSTGVPKGVSITHSGADNTIQDINQRIGLSENDSVLALSRLKIAVGFPSGTVVLDNIHSSVMYCERFAVPNMEFVPRDLLHADNGQICQESIKLLYHDPKVSYCTVLAEQWPSAIRKEMMDLKEKIGEKYSNADAARCGASVIAAAGLWSSIMECLGYPSVCENPQREYVPFSKLQRMRFGRLRHEERICRITKEHIDKCTEMLEEACLLSMLKTFYDVGLFSEQGDQHSLGEINKRLPHKEKFSYIIMRGLKLLVNKGFLKEREGLYSLQKDINRIAQLPKLWKNIEDLWCNQLGPECIYRYFYENAQVLDRLFTGEKTAAEMLFVGGRSDIADELYQNTLIAYSMNKFIAEQVAAYIAENENKVCILEIGAGTGATSKFVWKKIKLQKLSDKIRKYIFSDLSSYFLEDIKSTAQDYNFVETAIIDAEKLSEYEGLKDNSIDIIIAAGVINNVSDTDSVMKDLKRLLKNGGIILMSEATGESVPMLISQVFMMDAAEDARNASDSTFLSLEQWEKCFQNAGLNCVEQFPTSEHKLSALGQRVFVIRK